MKKNGVETQFEKDIYRGCNATLTVGKRGFNAETYRVKLSMIKAELDKMPEANDVKRYFEHIGKCLEFVDKTLDTP